MNAARFQAQLDRTTTALLSPASKRIYAERAYQMAVLMEMKREMGLCNHETCVSPAGEHGLCSEHYHRYKRKGMVIV